MMVEIKPELERRLAAVANKRLVPLEELVEEALVSYLNVLESEPLDWVKATLGCLPNAWPAEDFSDWIPPDGR